MLNWIGTVPFTKTLVDSTVPAKKLGEGTVPFIKKLVKNKPKWLGLG